MPKPGNPIPPGFHSLTAQLSVKGATAYIDFLQRAFNAVEIARSPGPGGKLMHVEVRIGDSRLMFADDFAAEFGLPPLAQGRLPFHLHLYVRMPTPFGTRLSRPAAKCSCRPPINSGATATAMCATRSDSSGRSPRAKRT